MSLIVGAFVPSCDYGPLIAMQYLLISNYATISWRFCFLPVKPNSLLSLSGAKGGQHLVDQVPEDAGGESATDP